MSDRVDRAGAGPVAPDVTDDPAAAVGGEGSSDGGAPWRRLSARMIWVDLAQSILALAPGAIALWVIGGDPSAATLGSLAVLAVLGVLGAVKDAMRWVLTRYRVTEDEVQRRTGLFVRRYRAVRRDRIRSVDTNARLRHRLAGLRVVTIGAGQQSTAGESAFVLDALSRADADALRQTLLRERRRAVAAQAARAAQDVPAPSDDVPSAVVPDEDVQVLARLRPWWVVYNAFSIWAYLMAAGLLWAAYWLVGMFGVDLLAVVTGLADWQALGPVRTTLVALVGVGAFGALGMACSFVAGFWRFELAHVRGEAGTFLRTRRGLFQTREVNRDVARMRGLSIGEPLLWRWIGMADTNVITTGLGLWSSNQPTAILPRGPVWVARRVAEQVLDEPSRPLDVPLPRHPTAALRRRLWWATGVVLALVAVVAWPVLSGAVPAVVLLVAAGLWPVALLLALAAHRALGHAIAGDHLVVRSGMTSRTTSVLRRDAVSTVALRQSVLQRRLGLTTVSAMTAAGWGVYEAPDVDAREAVAFAAAAAPGLLDPFLEDAAPRELSRGG